MIIKIFINFNCPTEKLAKYCYNLKISSTCNVDTGWVTGHSLGTLIVNSKGIK